MIAWLMEPWQYAFMRLGLAGALLAACACASLGVYVVLRRMSFIGDAVSHAVLPGLAVAFLLRVHLALGALAAALLTVLGVGQFSQSRDVHEDSAIGILFTGMFALGVVLMNLQKNYADLSHMLFGNILGVGWNEIALMGLVAALTLGCLKFFSKELFLTTCDPGYAFSIGLNPDRIRFLLLILLALAIVAGVLALGVVLTSALLVTPAATARLLTRRMGSMLLLSNLFAGLACLAGLYVSYYAEVSSGAAIILAGTLGFGVVWGIRRLGTQVRRPPLADIPGILE